MTKKKAAKIQYSFNGWIRDWKFHYRRGKGHLLRYAVDRIIWKWYPRFRIVRPFPEHVDLELSSVCNMRCPMCYTTLDAYKEQKKTFMELDLFKRLIDECAEGGAYSVRLSLRGEPLMHPHFAECVKYAKEKDIQEVSFLTNALLLDERMASIIVDAGVDWITISFDGIGETYNNIRKPAKYEEALSRIKDLVRTRDEKGRSKPAIKVQTLWQAVENKPEAYRKVFDGLVDLVAFNMHVDFEGSVDHDPQYFCKSPWERMVVYADGSVPKCINDPFSKDIIGNANKQTLREIWTSPAMRAVREKIAGFKRLEYASCRACSYGARTEKVNLAVGGRNITVGKRKRDFDVQSL